MRTSPGTLPLILASIVFLTAGCSDSTGPEDLVTCTGGTPLAVGATVNGTLAEGDELDFDGAYLDRYALAVQQGGTHEVTMRSTELDSFLWLVNPDSGDIIAFDDDSGGGLDARIVHPLDRGCYWVEATTFPGESGAYTLSVLRQ